MSQTTNSTISTIQTINGSQISIELTLTTSFFDTTDTFVKWNFTGVDNAQKTYAGVGYYDATNTFIVQTIA